MRTRTANRSSLWRTKSQMMTSFRSTTRTVSKTKHIFLILALALIASAQPAAAQKSAVQNKKAASGAQSKKKAAARAGATKEQSEAVALREKSRDDLVQATKDYKTSLEQLMALREEGAKRASAHVAKLKELYTEGLISRRDMEESEAALVESRHKVDEVRQQLAAADSVLVETLAELDALAQVASTPVNIAVPNITPHSYLKKTAYFRYNGVGNWSLSEAGKVNGFFISRFGRGLPVSAFGQTDVHNRLGFDHRNAMDVGVHPDSAEGRSLIAYLQSSGIPFLAFRQAIPGSATGPHIHIGRPSHRLAR